MNVWVFEERYIFSCLTYFGLQFFFYHFNIMQSSLQYTVHAPVEFCMIKYFKICCHTCPNSLCTQYTWRKTRQWPHWQLHLLNCLSSHVVAASIIFRLWRAGSVFLVNLQLPSKVHLHCQHEELLIIITTVCRFVVPLNGSVQIIGMYRKN